MSELGGDSFHQFTAASAVSQLFSALLQVKHPTQSPGLPNPVLVAGYFIMLFYLLYALIDLFPRSRFAAVAHHFLFSSAYATVGLLAVAVLPPASTPFLYTIFGLILAGRMLYLFGDRLVINWGDDADADGDEDGTWKLMVYKKRVYRFFKNMCRRVADFFRQQPNEAILPT